MGQLILLRLKTAELFLPSLRGAGAFVSGFVCLERVGWRLLLLALTALAQAGPPTFPSSALQLGSLPVTSLLVFLELSIPVWCSCSEALACGKRKPSLQSTTFSSCWSSTKNKKRNSSSSNVKASFSSSHSEAVCCSNRGRTELPVQTALGALVFVLSNINLWAWRKRSLSA